MSTHEPTVATRRDFLVSAGVIAAMTTKWPRASAVALQEQEPHQPLPDGAESDPAAAITTQTLAEAEKLAAVEFTVDERAQALEDLQEQVDRFSKRRTHALDNNVAPAAVFDPRLPGRSVRADRQLIRSRRGWTLARVHKERAGQFRQSLGSKLTRTRGPYRSGPSFQMLDSLPWGQRTCFRFQSISKL